LKDLRCIFRKHKWAVINKGSGLYSELIGISTTIGDEPLRMCKICKKKQHFLGAFDHPWGPDWFDIKED